MNQKFIQTQDAPTATLLSQLGYQQVQNSNGIYVFLKVKDCQNVKSGGGC